MFKVVVGHSEDLDAAGAAAEIIEQCNSQLDGRSPKGAILFSAFEVEHQTLLDAICDAWPEVELIGGSTTGEMSSRLGFAEDSVTLMAFAGDDEVAITSGIGRKLSADFAVGAVAVVEAKRKTALPPRLCFTVPESRTDNLAQMIGAINAALGPDVPLLGGTSGDQYQFKDTRQFYGREVLSDSVPILLFSGNLQYSFGVASGWKPIGEPGTVTRAEGTVVHAIDGRPAIDFYRKYLGQTAMPSPENPLAVLNDQGRIEYLRATLGLVDEQSGAVIFFVAIPQGARVQVAMADRDAILSGCEESVRIAHEAYPVGKIPEAALVVSCASRRFLLGTRTPEECKILPSILGENMPFCGFYSFGEIGPNQATSPACYHNESFVTVLLGG